MDNIINAVFLNSHTTKTCPRWKFDNGMILAVSGVELPEYVEIHIANTGDSTTTLCLMHNGEVEIPNVYFETGKDIVAYFYLHTGESGYTTYQVTVPVKPRPKPNDGEPTKTQEEAIDAAIEALNTSAQEAAESAESAEASAVRAEEAAASIDEGMIAEAVADYLDEHPVTVDYNDLPNLPTLNGVEIKGNKTSADYHIQGGEGDGLSDDVKQALLQIAQKVAYIDAHGADYYQDLYDALYPPANLVSISATFNQGSTVVYDTDTLDSLRPMLTVTATYDDQSTAVVNAYTLSGTLMTGSSTITVTYQGKTDTFTVNVTHESGVFTVTNNLTGAANSNSATSVTEGGSYSGTITANAGYTLTGATVSVTMGSMDITSTAYSNDTISIASVTGNISISVSAAQIVLSSISASYTQSGTVYDTDSLDSLKTDLVVTATYSDSSTATVPSTDYTMSGSLTEGTSTITVAYNEKTTTFSVTVTHKPVSGMDGWVDGGVYENLDIVQNEYVATATGKINSYNGWDRTGFVPCGGAGTIVFPPMPEGSSGGVAQSNWFYYGQSDSTKVSVFRLDFNEPTTITVPANANYFIISSSDTALAACVNGGIVPYA